MDSSFRLSSIREGVPLQSVVRCPEPAAFYVAAAPAAGGGLGGGGSTGSNSSAEAREVAQLQRGALVLEGREEAPLTSTQRGSSLARSLVG
jgi:hypothetical protein